MDDCFIYVGPSISGGFLEGDCGCHSNCQNNLTELKSHGRVLNEVYKKLFREIDDKARSGADETLIMKDRVQLLEKYGKDLKEQNRLLLWTLEQTQQEMMESKKKRHNHIECLENQLHECTSKVTKKEGKIQDFQRNQAEMEEMNAKLKEALAKTQQDLDTSKLMVIKKEGKIQDFQRNQAEMEELNAELKQDLDASKLMVREKEDKIQYFQRNQAEMEEMNAKLKETLAKTQEDLDASNLMVTKTEGKIQYFQQIAHDLISTNQRITNQAEMEEMNAKLKETLAKTQQDLDASKQMVTKKECKIQYFQQIAMKSTNQRITNQAQMKEMNAKLKETLAKTQQDLGTAKQMVTKKEGEIQYLQRIAMSTNQRITNQAQMKEMNELKETLAKTQQDLDTAKQMVTKKEGEIQYFQQLAHDMKSTNQRITNQAEMEEMNAKLKEIISKIQQNLDTAKQRMNRKDEQYEELKKETEGLRKQQSKDASRIAERDVEIQKLNSEIKMLKIKYREKAIDAQIQEDVNRKIHDELHNLRLHGRLYSSY